MWSIVSSMKLLRKPSKRGEGDIERNKGSSSSLKDHSKEVGHLDDTQVNLDPSCSTDNINGKGTSAGASGTKTKVERRESARLASSATKFLRSLRSHSGSGKIVASSVIAADDKHPINVIALKELDIETHSLNPGASQPGASNPGSSRTAKLPERSQSFNEKRVVVPTPQTSENSMKSGSTPAKVKHSRAQSFVCNNSSRNKSGYSVYLNHQQQYQSAQQNQANFAKQQLFDKHKKSSGNDVKTALQNTFKGSSSKSKTETSRSLKSPDPISASGSSSSRGVALQSCETIYENLEVILEEKQNQEHMTNKSNIPCSKDYKLGNIGKKSKNSSISNDSGNEKSKGERSEGGASLKGPNSSSLESLEANMKISKEQRPDVIRRYNKDSGYETSCSDYSNLPKSTSVDSIMNSRLLMEKSYSPSSSAGGDSRRILNTSLYEEANVSQIREDTTPKGTPTGGSRKLRRSISEVPAERSTNLAKLQTKVGDSTARAMYTIANGLAVWTTEKSSSSLGLNSNNLGSSQALHYQNVYGAHSQFLPSVAPIPGGFSAAIQQASVYSTLPRNHSSNTSNDFGFYRTFQYRQAHVQPISSHSQVVSSVSHNYQQIAAKSTPSLRNAVLQEHHQQNSFGERTDEKPSSSTSSTGEGQQCQTIPVPTLSPARSTPNLGTTKLLPRNIPHLSMVSSQQEVNDLGKPYPKTQSHQKFYNSGSSTCLSQQSLSSSVLLQASNDNNLGEPARYPSTPNLQKCDNTLPQHQHNEPGVFSEGENQCNSERNSSGSTNASNMSTSNDSVGSPGANWNSLEAQSILNNNSAPARDPSSLKQIRYGPGHEKYPSWPIPVSSAQQIDPCSESHPVKLAQGSGSTRSKSWTEQTDYPKEKTPSYARPYMKRVNHSYTQQLKTVMEKCERIPPEAFASQDPQHILHSHAILHQTGNRNHPHSKGNEGGIVPPPLLYRDLISQQNQNQNGHGAPIGYNSHHNLHHYYHSSQHPGQQGLSNPNGSEKDYMIPSPERVVPEKESAVSKPLTQEDLELYTKKYEELMTQYPQSEGYHSYISSDSSSYISSGTPFLDQLRRESENNHQFWSEDKNGHGSICDPNDPLFGLVGGQLASASVSGRESVTTVVTNSSSNSSGNETLKWHGSTSDISLASGVGGSMHSNGNSLKLSNNSGHTISSARKALSPNKWEQKGVVHSARLHTPQKQHAANAADPMCSQNTQVNGALQSQLEILNGSPLNKWNGDMLDKNLSQPNLKKFPLNTYTRPNALLMDKINLSQQNTNRSANPSPSATTPEKMAKLLQSLNMEGVNGMNLKGAKSLSHSLSSPVIDTSKPPSVAERIMELEQQSIQQQTTSPSTSGTSSPKMGSQNHSTEQLAFIASSFMKSSSLNNLPNSQAAIYPEDSQSNQQSEWGPGGGTALPRNFVQSLSTSTVNKVMSESNNAMSYSYLDPDKRHKVADMTLKAIQKKALLSYYERHKGKCTNTSSASSVSSSDGNSSQADGLSEKELCFPGKSNRLMLSLPKEQTVDQQQQLPLQNNLENGRNSSNITNVVSTSSPTLTGIGRSYRAISASSSGVSSSSSSSSRSSGASNYKPSSQSHHNSQGNLKSPHKSTGLPETIMQADKSEKQMHSTTPDSDSEGFNGSDSARLAYMSKYLPHLVSRDSTTSSTVWPSGKGKVGTGGASNNQPVTQEPAPIPPERPPKKPHLRNLAQQVHEENTDAKPPPPLPRAPVRPPALQTNGKSCNGPPPVPTKPVMSGTSGGVGVTRSPSPDELPPPPPPPPTEEMEVVINDEPLPPPPTVTEVDVIFGSRSRSVTGLSSCLHKDSYMAQRKERTLGYEGRYRRTLSPSGLGSNNSSKSSLDSASPGASDTARGPAGSGKLDSTMSPAAWEKFHNIRPPSTTVIFTSNELAKGISSPPSSSSPSTSGSPQPPVQSPFHRSISCDSNIFNNKTGASQSTIPPPIAQVAPLRGSHNDFESEKNRYMITSPAKEKESCSPEGDNLNGIRRDEKERGFQDSIRLMYERKRCEEQKPEAVARSSSMTFSNSVLPSVIVPPLQYEKYERESRSPGLTLNPNYSSESNLSILRKSEVSLRVNCNSVIDLQSEINELGADLRSKGPSPCPSSTDSCADAGMIGKGGLVTSVGNNSAASFYTGRQKTQEELECEELSRDIAKLLPQGDKLQTLLVPLPDHKTTADYMEGLFHLELKLQPETPERRGSISNQDDELPKSATTQEETNTPQKTVSPDLEELREKDELPKTNGNISQEDHFKRSERTPSSCSPQPEVAANAGEIEGNEKRGKNVIQSYRRCNGHAPLPADSAYFTTSECKAKFLTQYNNDIKKDPISGTDSEELDKQKEELVSRISKKLEILRTEQLVLREEIQSNEQLGHMVVERVKQTAKRNEFDKFKLHVEEIEKITSLLLGISGRLARAENALMGLSDPPNPQEKKILESKRDKLREQLDEAKILKENIDRRSAQVSSFLQKYLTVEEYADYDHFVKMKAKLIIDAREIDDKIKLGEEQLGALKDALNTMPFIPNTSP